MRLFHKPTSTDYATEEQNKLAELAARKQEQANIMIVTDATNNAHNNSNIHLSQLPPALNHYAQVPSDQNSRDYQDFINSYPIDPIFDDQNLFFTPTGGPLPAEYNNHNSPLQNHIHATHPVVSSSNVISRQQFNNNNNNGNWSTRRIPSFFHGIDEEFDFDDFLAFSNNQTTNNNHNSNNDNSFGFSETVLPTKTPSNNNHHHNKRKSNQMNNYQHTNNNHHHSLPLIASDHYLGSVEGGGGSVSSHSDNKR
jgi:hypothetical protein